MYSSITKNGTKKLHNCGKSVYFSRLGENETSKQFKLTEYIPAINYFVLSLSSISISIPMYSWIVNGMNIILDYINKNASTENS